MSDLTIDIDKRKLTKREAIIYDYIQPCYRKQFVKMSPYKRKRLIDGILRKLEKRNYDVSEFKENFDSSQRAVRNRYISKTARKTLTKVSTKTVKVSGKTAVKTAFIVRKKIKDHKQKEVMLDEHGNLTRRRADKEKEVTADERVSNEAEKKESKPDKKTEKTAKRKGSKVKNTIGRQVDKAMAAMVNNNRKKSRSIDEIQKEWRDKSARYAGRKAGKLLYKINLAIGKLIAKLVAAFVSALTSILLPFLPFIVLLVILIAIFTFLFGSVALEEERQQEAVGSYAVSATVLQHRDKILAELKKYGKEDYIDLFLAVVMQESGGKGNDIFQCSESLGKKAGTLSLDESIRQGVKVLCGHMSHEKVKVSSPEDIEHIKIALQAYNFGGGYITYINDTNRLGTRPTKQDIENLGKWTQENALAYQRLRSKVHGAAIPRTGSAAKTLGPFNYGDAYYTEHVLRYYVIGNAESAEKVKGINVNKRMAYLFPEGIPTDEASARQHMQTISVKIYTLQGRESSMNITVHKKLVKAYKQAFDGMYQIKFPIDPGTTAAFCWRAMASDSSKQSYHSYGTCIDINWNSNPATYTGGAYAPGTNPLSITPPVIKVWADAGFYWGGNWDGYYRDYMHFTYTNN